MIRVASSFLALLLLAGQAHAQNNIAADVLARKIADEIKGANSICYWFADLDAPRDAKGGFTRQMVNVAVSGGAGSTISTLAWWTYPAGAKSTSNQYRYSPYKALNGRLTCFAPGFAIWTPTIKPGKYGIDFSGSNDAGWHELLTITETKHAIDQEVVITKDGVGEVLRHYWHKAK